MYSATIGLRRYAFPDLKTLLARATPHRSGDQLAGHAAETGEERVAAQFALADLPLTRFLEEAVVPYETDEVTRLILDTHDGTAFAAIAHLPVGGFRDWILSDAATTAALAALAPGVTPEMAAAVAKISRLQDLMVMAAKCEVVTRFRNTIGARGRLSVRLQPQSSDRRPQGQRRVDPRRPAARRRRRRYRHQSGDRQPRARACARLDARRHPGDARHPNAVLRARAHHYDFDADRARRAGRSRVPVGRRQRGRQQELRHRSRAAARGP